MTYKEYYVYILTNYSRTVLYTGVTNNLERKLLEHKQKTEPSRFTAKYKVDLLVWFETHNDIDEAIRQDETYQKMEKIMERRFDQSRESRMDRPPEEVGHVVLCKIPFQERDDRKIEQ